MICLESQHFKLNRILLLAIGLWPYHKSKFVRVQVILLFGILTSFIIFQITTFVTAECTPHLIIKVLSMVLYFSTYVIEYISFWINPHKIKCVLERLQHVCNELTDENEIAIIRKYGNDAKRYTTIILCICIGATTVTARGTMLIGYMKHACGMFSIASYRIKQAITIKMLENIIEDETVIYKKIIYAIDIHRKAMKFSEFISSSFEGSFFLLILVGVTSLSLNLYAIYQTISLGNKEECLLHLIFVIVILLYMFLTNYFGQEITDHNDRVYATVYNIQWYEIPMHTQKLLLFMLQRSSKAFNLNVGGLFVGSLECFAALIKASMSYFTVICSTQQ